MHNGWLCLCVPGYVFTRTGQKRCKKSKYCRKMHNPRGQGFKSNLFIAQICKMHRHGNKQKMYRLATVERFTKPIQTVFRLEGGRIRVLS